MRKEGQGKGEKKIMGIVTLSSIILLYDWKNKKGGENPHFLDLLERKRERERVEGHRVGNRRRREFVFCISEDGKRGGKIAVQPGGVEKGGPEEVGKEKVKAI